MSINGLHSKRRKEPTKEDVLRLAAQIPHGRENAVSRKTLCEWCGCSDRVMRIRIAAARKARHLIVNLQDSKGYYFAFDDNEILRYFLQETARHKSEQESLNEFAKYLREKGLL